MHLNLAQSALAMRLFGLFIRCPFGQATKNCPFIDIRALGSLELKFRLAEKMAMHPECPDNISTTHEACCRERLRHKTAPLTDMIWAEERRKMPHTPHLERAGHI